MTRFIDLPEDERRAALAAADALYKPFGDFIENHPLFKEADLGVGDIGPWAPGVFDFVFIGNGHYTAGQLRAIADYMENNS